MTWATGKPSSFTVPGGEEVPQEAAETIPVSNTPVHVPAILLVEVTVAVLLVIVGDPILETLVGFTTGHRCKNPIANELVFSSGNV